MTAAPGLARRICRVTASLRIGGCGGWIRNSEGWRGNGVVVWIFPGMKDVGRGEVEISFWDEDGGGEVLV